MKNLNFLKLFFGTMLLIATTAFVSCVDDNDDTEAPYLEVSPTNLQTVLLPKAANHLLRFRPIAIGQQP